MVTRRLPIYSHSCRNLLTFILIIQLNIIRYHLLGKPGGEKRLIARDTTCALRPNAGPKLNARKWWNTSCSRFENLRKRMSRNPLSHFHFNFVCTKGWCFNLAVRFKTFSILKCYAGNQYDWGKFDLYRTRIINDLFNYLSDA